eukprot:1076374-Pleurochrysis_carterae.AAC.1
MTPNLPAFSPRLLLNYHRPPTELFDPPANSSSNGPRSRRLCSSGYTPDPQGLLATVLHVTDFNDDFLSLVEMLGQRHDALPPHRRN